MEKSVRKIIFITILAINTVAWLFTFVVFGAVVTHVDVDKMSDSEKDFLIYHYFKDYELGYKGVSLLAYENKMHRITGFPAWRGLSTLTFEVSHDYYKKIEENSATVYLWKILSEDNEKVVLRQHNVLRDISIELVEFNAELESQYGRKTYVLSGYLRHSSQIPINPIIIINIAIIAVYMIGDKMKIVIGRKKVAKKGCQP